MTVEPEPRPPGRATVPTVVAVAAVALAGSAVAVGYDVHGAGPVPDQVVIGLVAAAVAVVGAVVVLAVPRNTVGWLMLVGAGLLGLGDAVTEAGVPPAAGVRPAHAYLAALGPGLRGAGWIVAVVLVPAYFPDGRLPAPRWRWLGRVGVAAVAVMFAAAVLSPGGQEARLVRWHNPLGLPGSLSWLASALDLAGIALTVVAGIGALVSLVVRARRGGSVVRQQVALLAIAAVPPVVAVVLTVILGALPGWVFGVTLLGIPIAIAVAILGLGLYDLRRASYRALVWLLLSGTLVATYALVVAGSAALIGAHRRWLPAALAATVAALLLIPARGMAQRGVNRIIYGRWHEPYTALADLGEQLAAAADIDQMLDGALVDLAVTLDLRDVRITRSVDGSAEAVPLLAYGRAVGWLTFTPNRPLNPAERRLLADIAHGIGVAVHAQDMRSDLQQARERLVLAREDERRRLRRDLHDGIGPALAGLTLRAATVRRLLPPSAARSDQMMGDLIEEIRRTVVEVRQLVEGLRPPALDELGLVAACQQAVQRLTAGQLVATVDADALPPLPAAVEVAAYRIVVEAVTNVVQHAGAAHCRIRLRCEGLQLAVSVTDDGPAMPWPVVAAPPGSPPGGHGLHIMRERAEELGGTITLGPGGSGFAVHAVIPVARPTAAAVRSVDAEGSGG